jgi:hypothetical protein
LIPFFLAIYALLSMGKRARKNRFIGPRLVGFLFSLIVVVFLIALGKNTPIFPWLYTNVLTFDMFQAPTRISIMAIFCLVILAAIGVDSWHRPGKKGLYWVRLAVMAAASITFGALLAYFLSRLIALEIRPSFIRAAVFLGIWGIGFGFLTLKAPRKKDLIENQKWGWWQWAVVIWVGVDLLSASWGLNPGTNLNVYSQPSSSAAEVVEILDGGRLYIPPDEEYELKYEHFLRFDTFQPFERGESWESLRASLLPNVNILDGIPSANNFDPLIPGRYSNWIDIFADVDQAAREQMLNLMGVTVVERIDSSDHYHVHFDDRSAFPRFRWSSCGIPVESESVALGMITQNQIDFPRSVVLEQDNDNTNIVCNESEAEISLVSDHANLIKISINSTAPGYLVIADIWYPGWRASVDGMSVLVLRANYLFRSVFIPEGAHEVMLEYKSNVFRLGIIISGLSLISLLTLILYWFIARRNNKREVV